MVPRADGVMVCGSPPADRPGGERCPSEEPNPSSSWMPKGERCGSEVEAPPMVPSMLAYSAPRSGCSRFMAVAAETPH